MKFAYRILALEALAVGYVLLFLKEIISAPLLYGRLVAMFVGGTAMALFMQGPQYGTIHPISTRPVWIGLGVIIMGASLLWAFAIKGYI
jgi:hypothetical protein